MEHDDDLADDPQVIITLTASSLDDGDYDGLEPTILAINTSDDDRPGVTVTPDSLTNDEGGSATTYTAVLKTQPTAEVTVRAYTTSTRYPFERFLTFTTQNWNIPQEVQVDFAPVDSNTQDWRYRIFHSANYSPSVSVTLIDRDVSVRFGLGEVQPFEEDAGTVRVEVVAVTAGAGAPTTDFAARLRTYETLTDLKGRATAGSDFVGVDEQIYFPRDGFAEFVNDHGVTRYRQTVTFDVEILNDGIAEGTEAFGVDLDLSTEFRFIGAHLGSLIYVRVLIIADDDTAGVTISETSLEIDEGASDTYEVALESEPAGNVTVTVRGAAGTDLTPDPASLTFTKLNWIAPQTVTVTAGQDHDVLDEEDILTHTVSSSRDGIYDGLGAGDVSVSVTDNDRPPVTVSFESATYSPTEGDSFEVTVLLSGDPERTVVVPLTRTEQGGASVDDYSGVPANVTFNAGETEKSFTFTAIPDEVDDDGKSVELRFGSPPADGVSAGYIAESIVSIEDDDVPSPVTVSFGAGAYYVLERGAVQIVLTLDDDPERTVVIPLSRTNLGGASDADYRGVPASVTFNAGETEKVLTFTATHNRVDDDGKSVELGFDSPPAEGVIAGSISEAIVSITDDDRVGITVTPTVLNLDEGGSAKWYSVVLDSQPTENVTVRVYPNTTRASGRPTWEQFIRFTPRNWRIPRVFYIYSRRDDNTLGSHHSTFFSAKGGDYEGVSGDTLPVRATDHDVRASFGLVEMQPVDEDAGTVRVTVEGGNDRRGERRGPTSLWNFLLVISPRLGVVTSRALSSRSSLFQMTALRSS